MLLEATDLIAPNGPLHAVMFRGVYTADQLMDRLTVVLSDASDAIRARVTDAVYVTLEALPLANDTRKRHARAEMHLGLEALYLEAASLAASLPLDATETNVRATYSQNASGNFLKLAAAARAVADQLVPPAVGEINEGHSAEVPGVMFARVGISN